MRLSFSKKLSMQKFSKDPACGNERLGRFVFRKYRMLHEARKVPQSKLKLIGAMASRLDARPELAGCAGPDLFESVIDRRRGSLGQIERTKKFSEQGLRDRQASRPVGRNARTG